MPGRAKSSIRGQRKLLAIGSVVLLVLAPIAGAIAYRYYSAAPSSTVPDSLRSSVDFPLYYPQYLPEGYTVDASSVSSTQEVVTYNISYGTNSSLIISQQPLPPTFDFERFYEREMGDPKPLATDIGQARIGLLNGRKTASLAAGRTWILIAAPNGIEDAALENIVTSFRLVTKN